MTYSLIFTHQYEKREKKFLNKHPELFKQYRKTVQLLELNPYHPSLRLHALKGNMKDVHSVSINVSYRITIELLIQEQEIIFLNVGSHDELYG